MIRKIWGFLAFACASSLMAISVGITPGSYRQDGVVQCIGKEANHLLFLLTAEDCFPQVLPKLKPEGEPLALEIHWPKSVPLLRLSAWPGPKQTGQVTPVRQTAECNVYRVGFDEKLVSQRLIRNRWDIHITVWFRAPERLDMPFHWSLKLADGRRLSGKNILRTVGVIDGTRPLAKDYEVYICQPGTDCGGLPENLFQERLAYYKRLGLDTMEHIYWSHKPSETARKITASGQRITGLRGAGFSNLFQKYYDEKNFGAGGLVGSMDAFVRDMLTVESDIYRDGCLPCTSDYAIDWEPLVRNIGPRHDDLPTIKAFCKARKLPLLTPAQIKTTYAKDYAFFRQQQLCRPIAAIRQFLNKYRPGQRFYAEHGSGLPVVDLDYKAYDPYVDFHLPMIYTHSTMDFFLRTEAMTRYVSRNKLIPLTELSWPGGCSYHTLSECVMNLLSPALAGCAGVGQWPGLSQLDGGQHYAFWRAKVILAPVMDIFRKGEQLDGHLEPLPLRTQKLKLGTQVIDLSFPQWSASAILRMRKLKSNYAIGILNLHKSVRLHTRLTLPGLTGTWRLVEPDQKRFLTVTGDQLAKGVILQTEPNSPGIWLLTQRQDAAAGYVALSSEAILKDFHADQEKHSKQGGDTIQLGRKGTMEVTYRTASDGKGGTLPVLTVINGNTTVGFINSGGRIFNWQVDGGPNVVSNDLISGGLCMDMFWLPRTGRWSGDQTMHMTLQSCTNDGRQVTIAFTGTHNTVLPGLSIRKVYTLKANSPVVDVAVTIHNGNADAQNTFSYWNHHVICTRHPVSKYLVLNTDGSLANVTKNYGECCYPNRNLKDTEKNLLGRSLQPPVLPVFGLYDTQSGTGLRFVVPDDFLMNYRFDNTADIMMKPRTLKHNQSMTYRLQIDAIKASWDDFLKAVRKRAMAPKAICPQKLGMDLLQGKGRFTVNRHSPKATASVKDGILTIELPEEKNPDIYIHSTAIPIDETSRYLLSMDVKAEDLKFTDPKGDAIIYIYNWANNAHNWFRIQGNGSVPWTKILMPFNAKSLKLEKPGQSPRMLVRVWGATGRIMIRNIAVTPYPNKVEMKNCFVNQQGNMVPGAFLKVTP